MGDFDNRSRAVMENRVHGGVESDGELLALYRRLDFFPTPPWATRAGAEILAALDPECLTVADPACGQGHMAGPLSKYFRFVASSDIHAYTPSTSVIDWMDDAAWDRQPVFDWVFTNPPFPMAREFVTRGLRRARRGVALLVRMSFLESIGRYPIFAGGEARLTLLAPFSERVPMFLGRYDPNGSTATPYVWLFWQKDAIPLAPHWIPPGTKARLFCPSDVERYAKPTVKLTDPLWGHSVTVQEGR